MPGPWENLPDPVRPAPERPARAASRLGLMLWLGAVAGLVALLFALNRMFPNSLGGGDTAALVRGVGWFTLLSSGLLFFRQINLKQAARNILLWVGVFGVVLLGYAYRDVFGDIGSRLQSQVMPGYPVTSGPHAVTISEDESGGYQVIGSVNGGPVRFLIDTGASDIVLTGADAQRAGLDLDSLDYSHAFATANGIAHGASAMVHEIKVGGIVLKDVKVSVQREGLGVSLLGMSFLRQLKSFSFGDHKLVLHA